MQPTVSVAPSRLLRLAAAAAALGVVLVPAGALRSYAQAAPDTVRVMHLTLDSLRPDEIGTQTPNLQALIGSGTVWEEARSVMGAETLPNHVAMATGTYPDRNGIPSNAGRASVDDDALHVSPVEGEEDFGDPALLRAPSMVSVIEAACPDLRTVTVFSKRYVDNIFQLDPADSRFPQEDFNIPESNHAFDTTTVGFIQQELTSGAKFDYLFANLGDIDRAGHIDTLAFTGQGSIRQAAIEQTDTLVGSIVADLQAQGLWGSTVLIISSDHGMEFTNDGDPGSYVDIEGALEAVAPGRFFIADRDGSIAFSYLRDPGGADADQVLKAAREAVLALTGVEEALYRRPNSLDPGHDVATLYPDWHLADIDRAGELLITMLPGFKVSTPLLAGAAPSNPFPGVHGSPRTRHITAMISGGWDGLAAASTIAASGPVDTVAYSDAPSLPEQAEQVDWAPTIGWLLGVPDPGWSGGGDQWQGRVLDEAFARQPVARCAAGGGGTTGGSAGGSTGGTQTGGSGGGGTTPVTGGGAAAAGIAAVLVGVAARRRR